MEAPSALKYSENHEWVRVEGSRAVIGISDFAQEELGMIVFVELPEIGESVTLGEPLGSMESVKTVTEILSPITGKVVSINTALQAAPSKINEFPYDQGWMIEVEMDNPGELEKLWSAEKYIDVYGHE